MHSAPAKAELVRGLWANPRVRRLLPAALLALSAAGTGLFVWSEHERLAALAQRYSSLLSQLDTATTTTSTTTTEHDRQRVWDHLSTRPEILNTFLFCSCGCGEKVDFHQGQFEMKSGRVFNCAHFRCDGCGKQLQGTTATSTTTTQADHHGHEEDGWVFNKEGKLYCVYDFMDRFCHTCAGCGHELGDQLAVDPRLGAAFCVDCFRQHSSADVGQGVEHHFKVLEPVESQSQGDRLMKEVKQWLSQEMGLEFAGADGDIPLSLYRPEKIDQLKGMGKQHMKAGHDEKMGSTLGLTVKEASRPSLFAKKTYTPKEVILVKGLSQDHAGAVLAHEMMHCWIALYLSQTSELPEEVEEGLCELMSYFWLVQKRNQTTTTQAAEKREEVEYLLGRMERNWDNAQGRGFHRALTSLQAQEDGNLQLLLAHARQHSAFPAPLPAL